MPQVPVKEVRLSELHLPEIKRDDIVRSLSEIRLPEISQWRLSEANEALTALRARQVPGKAVIVPDAIWPGGAE